MEKSPSKSDFSVGTLVFAKMTGFPYWPGIVTNPTEELKTAPAAFKEGHRCIFFFGSRNFSWIEVKKLKLYSENKNTLSKTTKTIAFRKSCEEIEDFIDKGLNVSSLIGEEDVDSLSSSSSSSPPSLHSSSSSPILSSPLLSLSSLSPSPSDKTSESLDASPKCSDETKQEEVEAPDETKKTEEEVSVETTITEDKVSDAKIAKEAAINEDELPKSDDSSSKSEDLSSLKIEESSDENKESSSSEIEDSSSFESEEDISRSSKVIETTKRNIDKRKSESEGLEKKPKRTRFSTGNKENNGGAEFSTSEEAKPSTSKEALICDISSLDSNSCIRVKSPNTSTATQIESVKPRMVNPSQYKIGFIGIGKMGSGMVKNLLKYGNKVTIWNRTQETCEESINAGAQGAMTPGDVIEDSDITFCCVTDDTAAKEIVFGNCGVLPEIKEGKSYVEMSGTSDITSIRIGQAISARGGRYLEVRFQGAKSHADDGTLVVMAAGDKTLYDDCQECFDAFSVKRHFLGNVGKASYIAPFLNALNAVALSGCFEMLALSELFNFSKEDLLTFCEENKLLSQFVLKKCRAALKGDFSAEMTIRDLKKNTGLALDYANRHFMEASFIGNAHEYIKLGMSLGYGEFDISKLALLRK